MSQNMDRNSYFNSLLLAQHHGLDVNTIIDVGAAEGVLAISRDQVGIYRRKKQVFIDCMSENEAIYQKFREKIDSDYVIAAISDRVGEIEIHVDPNAYNTHVEGAQAHQEGYVPRNVPCTTLDTLTSERDWDGPYYIHLDLQGNELKAMQGAIETLKKTHVVVAELQLFGADTTFSSFTAFMVEQGFTLFDVTNQAYYMTSPVLYQFYATYIPAHLDFRDGLEWADGETLANTLAGLKQRRAHNIEGIHRALDALPSRE